MKFKHLSFSIFLILSLLLSCGKGSFQAIEVDNTTDYRELSQFSLFDAKGEEGGLSAKYVTGSGEVFTERKESEVDYENLETIKKFPEGFPFG